VDAPLARPPVEVGVMPHWLFINGVQPAVPENAPLEKPGARRTKAAAAAAGSAQPKEGPKQAGGGCTFVVICAYSMHAQ